MKNRTLVLIPIFIFVVVAIFIFASCDTTGNGGGATPTFTTTFGGTWVNPDYDGTSGQAEGGSPAKTVTTDNGDGTYTVKLYDFVSDTVPTETITITLTDEWTDSEGNVFFKVEFWVSSNYVYELVKLHADNQTLEATLSDVDYPTEIDPTGWYAIYYRQ